MARSRVGISRAWITHWSVLFPETPPWKETLEHWAITNLSDWRHDEFITETTQTWGDAGSRSRAKWLASLSVSISDLALMVRIGDKAEIKGPLFADALIMSEGDWVERNPIERLLACDDPDQIRYRLEDTKKFVTNVTLRAGAHILQRLERALRSNELCAWGLASGDPFGRPKKLPVEKLENGFRIDVLGGQITLADYTVIRSVTIGPGAAYKHSSINGRSFEAADSPLIEEMHDLLQSGKASSVREAATMVAPKAKRRGSIDSAVERLQKRYGRKYPRRPG